MACLELRLVVEEVLASARAIEPMPETPAECARYPAGGFSSVPLLFR